MRQIFQDLRRGSTELIDVPVPNATSGHLLIRTERSLISAGTERMLVDFGRGGLIEKARQQPDKVRMVMDKVRTDGLLATVASVRSKLDQPLPMGYCSVGRVLEVGAGVPEFAVGDRVASNGKHAEVASVPRNLCAKVPDSVTADSAAFTVLGAIALQGIRLAEPTLGETVVVTGLGLIGLITVQLLRAQGCRVIGIDFEADKLDLARRFGAETFNLGSGGDPVAAAVSYSRGRGVDAVIITASTKSSEPMHHAARMCRKRGRIILVGVTGLELSRADLYEKELTLQVSCSYGPGRYDPTYEVGGHDYPVGFVRWTQQRNFEAVLDMMADARIDVAPLVSHRFPLGRSAEAYELLAERKPSLGILLEYDSSTNADVRLLSRRVTINAPRPAPGRAVIGFIGAGNYATRVLIPAFAGTNARLKSVVSNTGATSVHAARRNGIEVASTDARSVFTDAEIDALVVATRHDSHAQYVIEGLRAGKHVFVEKPICIDRQQLAALRDTYLRTSEQPKAPHLMVGFNRRFAPHVVRVKALLRSVGEPKVFVITVNAGALAPEHWTQDRAVGGGRIIGEACHFIDLLRFLADAPVRSFKASRTDGAAESRSGNATLTLEFEDGSMGTVHYFVDGHRAVSKERLEVFCAGRILQLDNFRTLKAHGWPGFSRFSTWRQDKGQTACAAAFVDSIQQGHSAPIPFDEIIEVAELTLRIDDALRADG